MIGYTKGIFFAVLLAVSFPYVLINTAGTSYQSDIGWAMVILFYLLMGDLSVSAVAGDKPLEDRLDYANDDIGNFLFWVCFHSFVFSGFAFCALLLVSWVELESRETKSTAPYALSLIEQGVDLCVIENGTPIMTRLQIIRCDQFYSIKNSGESEGYIFRVKSKASAQDVSRYGFHGEIKEWKED